MPLTRSSCQRRVCCWRLLGRDDGQPLLRGLPCGEFRPKRGAQCRLTVAGVRTALGHDQGRQRGRPLRRVLPDGQGQQPHTSRCAHRQNNIGPKPSAGWSGSLCQRYRRTVLWTCRWFIRRRQVDPRRSWSVAERASWQSLAQHRTTATLSHPITACCFEGDETRPKACARTCLHPECEAGGWSVRYVPSTAHPLPCGYASCRRPALSGPSRLDPAPSQPGPSQGTLRSLSEHEIEALQEVISRAHYLTIELRDVSAVSGVGAAALSVAAVYMLKNWAIRFSQELEDATRQVSGP